MDYFEAKCSLCPKHFTSSKALSKHKLQVHIVADNEIGCEECGKKLKNEYQLKLAVGMDSGQKRLLVTLTVNAEEKEKEAGFKDTSTQKSYYSGTF